MKKSTKEALKFWGAITIGGAVPGSVAALMGAPWWGVVLSALFIPFLVIGLLIAMVKVMTSIF